MVLVLFQMVNICSLYSTHADGKIADEFLICRLDDSCYGITAS